MIDGKFDLKKEVPQISPVTNVSLDYVNAFTGLILSYRMKGIPFVKDTVKENFFTLKKYKDYYFDYGNVVNEKNKDRIKQLDELVDQFNQLIKNPDSINYENDFIRICNEMLFVIIGNRSKEIKH